MPRYSNSELRRLRKLGSSWSYAALLEAYPWTILTLQTVLTQVLAKFVVSISITHKPVPAKEYICCILVGSLYINPVLLTFFGFLRRSGLPTYATIAIDQLCFSPCFTFGIIMISRVLLLMLQSDFNAMAGLWAEVPEIVAKTLAVCPLAWCFWIPQRALSTSFVPPIYSLPVNQLCSFVWTCIFTLLTSKKV